MLIRMQAFIAILLLSSQVTSDQFLYAKIDVAYVFDEANYYFSKDLPPVGGNIVLDQEVVAVSETPNIATIIEIGWENRSGYSYGIRHTSTPEAGCPWDCDEHEYYKNELFIGYKFGGIKN